ncbi:MAG: hypothetical protein K6U02_03070 [Firmicutes bacterium]|nr:hypothetical protein [Bacillota bacterium]
MEPKLSENHRRVVSVLLQQAEMVCDELERWLSRPSGWLNRIREKFPPSVRNQLCAHVKQARKEISCIAAEWHLTSAVVARRQRCFPC